MAVVAPLSPADIGHDAKVTVSPTQRNSTSRLMAAGLLVFGLAACSDTDKEVAQSDSPAPATGSSSPTPTAPEPDQEPESPDDDTEGPDEDTDEDSDDAAHASGTACLLGTWLTDNENVGTELRQFAGDAIFSAPTGEVLITYSEDGRQSVTYRAWTFEMSQDGITVEVVRDGTDTGTYEATDDGHLTTADVEMGSVVSMKSPAGSHSTPGEATSWTGTFSCQGDILEVTTEGATSILYRQ